MNAPIIKRGTRFHVPPSAPRTQCRSCRAPIVWIMTANARRMPVDADTGESHFATCAQADMWRRDR